MYDIFFWCLRTIYDLEKRFWRDRKFKNSWNMVDSIEYEEKRVEKMRWKVNRIFFCSIIIILLNKLILLVNCKLKWFNKWIWFLYYNS